MVLSELPLDVESWRTFIKALCTPPEPEEDSFITAGYTAIPGAPLPRKKPTTKLGTQDGMLDTLVLEDMKAIVRRVEVPGGMTQTALAILTEALQPIFEQRAQRFSSQPGTPLFERINLSYNKSLESENNGGWGAVFQTDPSAHVEQQQEQGNARRGGRARGYAWVPEGELALMHTALGHFVAHLGRFTRRLALDGISLVQSDLLFDATEGGWGPTSTQVLSLAKGNVPDDAFLGIVRGCTLLTRLNLESSGIEQETAEQIVANNPFLEALDLTQCRSIPRGGRRRFFEEVKVATTLYSL